MTDRPLHHQEFGGRTPLGLLLSACIVALGLVAALNYRVDPVGLFDEGELAQGAARALIDGKTIAATNLDDRQLHLAYARLAPVAPDTLILGSSRMMAVSDKLLGGASVYNASASSATLPDLLAISEAFLASGKKPKRILIGLDTWLLDTPPRNSRWRVLSTQFVAMRIRLKLPATDVEGAGRWSRVKALFGLSLTLESIGVLRAEGLSALMRPTDDGARILPPGNTTIAAKRPDGSLRYGAAFRERRAALVRAAAVIDGRQLVTYSMRDRPPAPDAVATFVALVRYLSAQGIDVIFVLPPFHPVTYAWAQQRSRRRFLSSLEARYRVLARRVDVVIAGSYDPAEVGCSGEEFFDGTHPKAACLKRLLAAVIKRRIGR